MTDQKRRNPAFGSRASNVHYFAQDNWESTNLIPFRQEPLAWQAHRECFQRLQDDPSPTNRMIATLVAAHWRKAFGSEVSHGA